MNGRESILLNGTWDHGDIVPAHTGIVVAERKTFSREVAVPHDWQNKRIILHFNMVNFTSDIYVNDRHVTRHIGGWVPFDVDITEYARPGESFALRVDVLGRNVAPYVDDEGAYVWPCGSEYEPHYYNKFHGYAGILDDVFLRAYGKVYIQDVYVKSLVSEGMLELEYTLVNTTGGGVSAVVDAQVAGREIQGTAEVALDAGATARCTLRLPADTLERWWPDAPALHFLASRLLVDGAEVDLEVTRFGYREVTVDKTILRLNGVRFNIVSDYCLFYREKHWGYRMWSKDGAREALERLKSVGVNMVRWHKMPVPRYVLDLADEMGMCVEAESAVGSWGDGGRYNYERLMENYRVWAKEWIIGCRNHPSIIIWCAANEPVAPHAFYTTLGRKFYHQYDTTRPVLFEFATIDHVPEDADIDIYVYHYPRPRMDDWRVRKEPAVWNGEPWNKEAGFYDAWREFLREDMPVSMGEGLHSNCGGTGNYTQKRNEWWQGIWTRGMRYTNWAIIGPASFRWVRYVYEQNPVKLKNLRCAYARVALFDKAYDALGVEPYITGLREGGVLPELAPGGQETRTLVLYNDEFRDTQVEIEVEVAVDGVVYAGGKGAKRVELGEHVEFDYTFSVPDEPGRTMTLTLRTRKGGVLKFEEEKRFHITGGKAVAPGLVELR